jgi:two-component system, LuxR family, response regulator FixJ
VSQGEAVVYVVDDDEAVRDSLKILLESYGMTVEDYASTSEFSRHHVPGRRACMVLDLHLPGTNGLDFLDSPQAPSGMPVIMISGRADATARARAVKAGVVIFLDKPVADDQLIDNIRRILA